MSTNMKMFDLVILKLNMPKTNGFKACNFIKNLLGKNVFGYG